MSVPCTTKNRGKPVNRSKGRCFSNLLVKHSLLHRGRGDRFENYKHLDYEIGAQYWRSWTSENGIAHLTTRCADYFRMLVKRTRGLNDFHKRNLRRNTQRTIHANVSSSSGPDLLTMLSPPSRALSTWRPVSDQPAPRGNTGGVLRFSSWHSVFGHRSPGQSTWRVVASGYSSLHMWKKIPSGKT